MTWVLDFYHERHARIAQYTVEAASPVAARLLGRTALLADYPAPPGRRRRSLVERAERTEGHDGSGWVLYRIMRSDAPAG
jgi:hypothetical protein